MTAAKCWTYSNARDPGSRRSTCDCGEPSSITVTPPRPSSSGTSSMADTATGYRPVLARLSPMSAAAGTLVLFDCDGVLVDSERLVLDIDVAAVTAAGWPLTREQAIEAFVGRSNADVVAMIEAQVGHPLTPGWDAAWEVDYRRVFDELLEPVPGVGA